MQGQKVNEVNAERMSYYKGTEMWLKIASQSLLCKLNVSTQDPARTSKSRRPQSPVLTRLCPQ